MIYLILYLQSLYAVSVHCFYIMLPHSTVELVLLSRDCFGMGVILHCYRSQHVKIPLLIQICPMS